MQKTKLFLGIFIFMMMIVPGMAKQTEVRNVDAFKALKSSSSIDVVLEKGNAGELRVESEKVELDKIITEVENNVLHIYLKRPNSFWSYTGRIVVYVAYDVLEGIKSSGSGDVKCKTGIDARFFKISNSGSGNIWLKNLDIEGDVEISNSGSGDINIEKARCNLFNASMSGSGDMRISAGTANEVDLSTNGSGDISAGQLKAKTARARTSGSGDIRCHASQQADARISGSGDITVSGNPSKVNKRKTGSGDVRIN